MNAGISFDGVGSKIQVLKMIFFKNGVFISMFIDIFIP